MIELKDFEALIEQVRKRFSSKGLVFAYGHVGDYNLHLGLMVRREEDASRMAEECDDYVYGLIKELGGSVSAEHGIGVAKKEYLEFSKSCESIELMRKVKECFDPKGILNPGKLF